MRNARNQLHMVVKILPSVITLERVLFSTLQSDSMAYGCILLHIVVVNNNDLYIFLTIDSSYCTLSCHYFGLFFVFLLLQVRCYVDEKITFERYSLFGCLRSNEKICTHGVGSITLLNVDFITCVYQRGKNQNSNYRVLREQLMRSIDVQAKTAIIGIAVLPKNYFRSIRKFISQDDTINLDQCIDTTHAFSDPGLLRTIDIEKVAIQFHFSVNL